MPRKIVICSQKGGVGKTTTAVNLASGLAKLGHKVLIVDSDSQAETTIAFGFDKRNTRSSLYDLLLNPSQSIEPIICNCGQPSLWLLPACSRLASAEIELVNEMGREFILREKLKPIQHLYDYIIIDCAPGIHLLSVNALFFGQEVIIPMQSQFYALEGIDQIFHTIHSLITRMDHPIKILGILCTMYDKRTRLSPHVLTEMYGLFGRYLFSTIIGVNTTLAEAPAKGQSIFSYAPSCQGANDYLDFAKEVVARGENPHWDDLFNLQSEVIGDINHAEILPLTRTLTAIRPIIDKVIALTNKSKAKNKNKNKTKDTTAATKPSASMHSDAEEPLATTPKIKPPQPASAEDDLWGS